MTPAEVAAILRQFNEWRRSDYEPSEQPEPPDPREIGEAIDSAIEILDRLEAAEKDAAHQKALAESALRVAEGWEEKCNTLRAKIEAMEKQKPVGWQVRSRPTWNDGPWSEWRKCSEGSAQDIKNTPLLHDWHYEVRALYTLPDAK